MTAKCVSAAQAGPEGRVACLRGRLERSRPAGLSLGGGFTWLWVLSYAVDNACLEPWAADLVGCQHQSHCPRVRPGSTGRRCMKKGLSPGPGTFPSGHLVYSLNLGFCSDQLTDLGKLPASLSCLSTVGTFSLGHGPHPAFPGRTLPASPLPPTSSGPACLHLTQHALPLVHMLPLLVCLYCFWFVERQGFVG